MLTVACVEHGNYQGRGAEYVAKLHAMVKRHLAQPFVFICLNGGDRQGWWNKIDLFRPGLFKGRVLYLDLDTLVTGPLDGLAASKGILHLDRWGWSRKVYGSGVMVWDAGEHEEIYTRFSAAVPRRHEGDQDWITELGGWPALPDGLCVSYRYHCKQGVPPGASVVCFHGRPKPHEFKEGTWVHDQWR